MSVEQSSKLDRERSTAGSICCAVFRSYVKRKVRPPPLLTCTSETHRHKAMQGIIGLKLLSVPSEHLTAIVNYASKGKMLSHDTCESNDGTFHQFPRLPYEIRLMIWRCCMPYRFREVDQIEEDIFWPKIVEPEQFPCNLFGTTRANSQPPLISRVCREARREVFKLGSTVDMRKIDAPATSSWRSGTLLRKSWNDHARDTPLMNWTQLYGISYGHSGQPLDWLAWQASQANGTAAINVTFFEYNFLLYKSIDHWKPHRLGSGPPNPPSDQESLGYISALSRLQRCLIIMRVIIIHTTVKHSQGLFGLAGDSRVQVLDAVAEADKIESFFDLARLSTVAALPDDQDLTQDTPETIEKAMKDIMGRRFCSDRVNELVRPAIMFRLCTRSCTRKQDEPSSR